MKRKCIIFKVMLIIISLFCTKSDCDSKFHLLETGGDKDGTKAKPIISKRMLDPDKTAKHGDYADNGDYYDDKYDDYEIDDEEENYRDEGPNSSKGDTSFLSGLRDKLGVAPPNTMFRSSGDAKKQKEGEKKMHSLVVNSLISRIEPSSGTIHTCFPDSLIKWKKSKEKGKTEESSDIQKRTPICDVTIPDLLEKKHKGSKETSWDRLNKKLKEDSELLSPFPKGVRPPTLSSSFKHASKVFADKYLISEKSYTNVLAKIAFFKEHPEVNEVLLDYAVTNAMLSRKDLSSDIPNPIETDDVYFNKPNQETKKEIKLKTKGGSDYSLYIPRAHHNLVSKNEIEHSGDPEESKLDYWREESLFHAFHALFHKMWTRLSEDKSQYRFQRTFELFFYTHQQMMRRNAVERFLKGLKPVIPLDPKEFRKPLGPGYQTGWYAWKGLGGRKDNCNVPSFNASYIDNLDDLLEKVQSEMNREQTYEEFTTFFEKNYHAKGHMIIAKACSSIYNPPSRGMGLMAFSEVSARDPIFYRWHTHIEDLVKEFRDKRLPPYQMADFDLSDGIEVVSINTLIDKNNTATKKDVKNILITLWENAKITHDALSTITYNRMNHLNFKYQVLIKNPNQVTKKVFVRIWLGILTDENDISTYDPKYMLEMDQFVHTLSGSIDETIERHSTESAATMKEQDSSLKRLMYDIKNNKATGTWCGLPHNLLVPRSVDYNPDEKDLGGKRFVLFAFINDVDQDVKVGSDSIEHMMCGHKDINTKLDDKPFGFPFDRKISFKITGTQKFVAGEIVKIMYRSDKKKQSEIGVKLNEMEEYEDIEVEVTTHTATSEIEKPSKTAFNINILGLKYLLQTETI